MIRKIGLPLVLIATIFTFGFTTVAKKRWVSLFDGHTLNGWKVGNNAGSFTVDSGRIEVRGNTAHLFYDGPLKDHQFKNFEFKADVMTFPGANSGIYFHSKYQADGWPSKGYEVQVNNSQSDWRRTGSIYNFKDVKEVYVKDGEWFTESFVVKGKHVTVSINGKVINEYTEPENAERRKGQEDVRFSSGTFALQAHDPGSVIYYKNIKVTVLPD